MGSTDRDTAGKGRGAAVRLPTRKDPPMSEPGAAGLPPRIAGVDFSGAVQAGRKVWVTLAEPDGPALRVRSVQRALHLPGGAPERAPALAALVDWLLAQAPCAAGLDFPFGLHRDLVPERSLTHFVAAFAGRYPDARTFRAACRDAGGERSLRRRCDLEARTPFAPHNLRLYRQTWHGIAEVLAPLCAAGARLLPLELPEPGRLWLLETCPASTLKRRGWYGPYKGRTAAHRAARAALLAHVTAQGVAVPRALHQSLLEDTEGDALDSVICAWIAWQALRDPPGPRPPLEPEHRVEGYVYA
jgi:hypothetical protein